MEKTMEDTTTIATEAAYIAPNGEKYTAERLAALTEKEMRALAESVVRHAISSLDDSDLVWFVRSYEVESYGEYGSGFDVFEVGEFCGCMYGCKPDKWRELVDDIIAAAVNGRCTGSDWIHYDSCGYLYVEDWDDITHRAREVEDDFTSDVCEYIDPDDLTIDLRYVDVPEEVDDALEELADAYSDARDAIGGE